MKLLSEDTQELIFLLFVSFYVTASLAASVGCLVLGFAMEMK